MMKFLSRDGVLFEAPALPQALPLTFFCFLPFLIAGGCVFSTSGCEMFGYGRCELGGSGRGGGGSESFTIDCGLVGSEIFVLYGGSDL